MSQYLNILRMRRYTVPDIPQQFLPPRHDVHRSSCNKPHHKQQPALRKNPQKSLHKLAGCVCVSA